MNLARGRPLAFHVMMRLDDDRVIARTAGERRTVARIAYEQGAGRGLVAFRLADTHLHALIAAEREAAGLLARYVGSSIRHRLRVPVPFAKARIKPVLDQRHLSNAFRYVLTQEERHGTLQDPFHDGSSLPELVGLRGLDTTTPELVSAMLPRYRSEDFLRWIGRFDRQAELGWEHLAEAAAGVADLAHPSRDATSARRAAVAVARAGGLCTAEIAGLLGLTLRTVQRLWPSSPDEALARAVMVQVTLRSRLVVPKSNPGGVATIGEPDEGWPEAG
jgi:hypothetical protein